MDYKFDIYDFDVICDILAEEFCDDFVELIKENYEDELDDKDDNPLVYIGIGLAYLENEKKLTKKLLERIVKALNDKHLENRLQENEEYYRGFLQWREDFIKQITEIKPRKKEKYISPYEEWQINDFYAVNASKSETDPKYVIFRVVDFIKEGRTKIVYIYMCFFPDFHLPSNIDEVRNAIYIPTGYTEYGDYDINTSHYKIKLLDNYFKYNVTKEFIYIGNENLPFPIDDSPREIDGMMIMSSLTDMVNAGIATLNRVRRKRAGKWYGDRR